MIMEVECCWFDERVYILRPLSLFWLLAFLRLLLLDFVVLPCFLVSLN